MNLVYDTKFKDALDTKSNKNSTASEQNLKPNTVKLDGQRHSTLPQS